jgi:hypothetical protein
VSSYTRYSSSVVGYPSSSSSFSLCQSFLHPHSHPRLIHIPPPPLPPTHTPVPSFPSSTHHQVHELVKHCMVETPRFAMIGRATWSNLQMFGDESNIKAPPNPRGGHLSCFFPGLLALYVVPPTVCKFTNSDSAPLCSIVFYYLFLASLVVCAAALPYVKVDVIVDITLCCADSLLSRLCHTAANRVDACGCALRSPISTATSCNIHSMFTNTHDPR